MSRHAFLSCGLASNSAPTKLAFKCFRRSFRARKVRALTTRSEKADRSVPLGKCCRSKRLVFSSVPGILLVVAGIGAAAAVVLLLKP